MHHFFFKLTHTHTYIYNVSDLMMIIILTKELLPMLDISVNHGGPEDVCTGRLAVCPWSHGQGICQLGQMFVSR